MHNKRALQKAFTIIELLVSIVVIGILVSIMLVSYGGIQQRSRDSDRASDITQLKIAIEKYHADTSTYPSVCSADNVECAASSLATALNPYIKTIPHDPSNVADSATDYRYIRGITTADSYGLLVNYEAKTDCKTGQNIDPTWWTNAIPSC
jgi:prepilin-type N-terminal cleavage/methylation domain-containing protein